MYVVSFCKLGSVWMSFIFLFNQLPLWPNLFKQFHKSFGFYVRPRCSPFCIIVAPWSKRPRKLNHFLRITLIIIIIFFFFFFFFTLIIAPISDTVITASMILDSSMICVRFCLSFPGFFYPLLWPRIEIFCWATFLLATPYSLNSRHHPWWLIGTCCKSLRHALLFWSIWWLLFLCDWLTAWSQGNFLVYSSALRFGQYILKQIWWHRSINNFIT